MDPYRKETDLAATAACLTFIVMHDEPPAPAPAVSTVFVTSTSSTSCTVRAFEGTTRGSCVRDHFAKVRVMPVGGTSFTITRPFTLGPKR